MELTVNTSKPYRILIEDGCLSQIGKYASELFPQAKRTVVVSDSNVLPLYAERVVRSLGAAGFAAGTFEFPAGEESKRLSSIESICRSFAENELTRSDFAVALGGGVTGDMAGFAAAAWLRGIPFLQIPTTLLAQIDSSVGGKTGVDLPEGKNLVGAFHQPSLVLIDPETLSTLPPLFFSDGMGEAVKYGCIRSRELFDRIKNTDVREDMKTMIAQCVDIKRTVVERDEFDNGERMLLNFGHTFGHALERLHGYRDLTHGAAVGIGMVMMARMGEAWRLTEPGTSDEIAAVLRKHGLPDRDDMEIEKILDATASDKKNRGDKISLVLLKRIGDSFLYTVPRDKFRKLAGALERKP